MRLLEAEHRYDSVIRRLPAPAKAGASFLLLLGIAAVPLRSPHLLLLPCLCIVVIFLLSRVPPLVLLRRLLVLEPFALAAAALALFRPDGWGAFWMLLAKSTLSLTLVILLSATTPFSDLLGVLRSLRFPRLLLTTIALLYRYLFVLVDQTERMRRARAGRTFVPARGRVWLLNGGVIAHLAIRSMERAERVYAAMRARGWQ